MVADDIEAGMKLSNAEGWNQTEKDWELLLANYENICLVAEYDNKVIGTTTAINYSNSIAWIGMVLVDKEFRGQGISKSLLTNIFAKLVRCKSVKLDATPEGKQVYEKLDFKDEYVIVRMTHTLMKNIAYSYVHQVPERVQLKHIPEIIELDEVIFGANRKQLITALIQEYPRKAWILRRNNQITGFVLGRDGNKYQQVGPVIASNFNDAKILLIKALNDLANVPVVIDVLSDKYDLLNWLDSIEFTKQRHFIRMYQKENPFPGITGNQYLICGPEFG